VTSLALKNASQDGPEEYTKSFPELVAGLGIKASRFTIERVMQVNGFQVSSYYIVALATGLLVVFCPVLVC